METDPSVSLAYHESGHLVIGCVHGLEVGYITIVPDPNGTSAGEVRFFDDFGYETNPVQWAKLRLLCESSGLFAACYEEYNSTMTQEEFDKHRRVQLKVAGLDETEGDIPTANQLLEFLQESGQDREECKQQVVHQVLELVSRYWPAIKALSEVLLIEMTMTGEQVNPILKPFGIVARRT